jgi:hypothetical protein
VTGGEVSDLQGSPWGFKCVGGVNLPTAGKRRLNATYPFGLLSVSSDNVLEVRLRSAISRFTRAESLQATPSGLLSVFPVRSPKGYRGLGFQRTNGVEYYFHTRHIDEILVVLTRVGFSVSAISRLPPLWRNRA